MDTIITEEWRPVAVVGFEGSYEVSALGRVRSVDRMRMGLGGPQRCDGKILRPRINKLGYQQGSLYCAGLVKTFLLHRLVALSFIPNPDHLPMVNHIDGIKSNCAATNLEWTDDRGNKQHAINTGLITLFKKLLTPEEVAEIRRLEGTMTQTEIAKLFGVTQTNVSVVLGNGKRQSHRIRRAPSVA